VKYFLAGLILNLIAGAGAAVDAQRVAKYGADFLAGGVDARALALGNAYVSVGGSASSTYWNASGLAGIDAMNLQFMHAERFAGIVTFDFAAGSMPVTDRSSVGVGIIRSAVNDIQDTRDAWDYERDVPKPDPQNYFSTFSNADYAFLVSYARSISSNLSWGATGKIIFRKIGNFAEAWGYSTDISATYRTRGLRIGVNLQDATTMLQSWSINTAEFEEFRDVYGVPEGGTELVLPVLRIGTSYETNMGVDFKATALANIDVAFDGQQVYAINSGDISYHPRVGFELDYKSTLALRAGLSRISQNEGGGLNIQPSIGAGFRVRQVSVSYAFGDFSGLTSDLGNSHMLSVGFTLGVPAEK